VVAAATSKPAPPAASPAASPAAPEAPSTHRSPQ
jgi:hypothetical protein